MKLTQRLSDLQNEMTKRDVTTHRSGDAAKKRPVISARRLWAFKHLAKRTARFWKGAKGNQQQAAKPNQSQGIWRRRAGRSKELRHDAEQQWIYRGAKHEEMDRLKQSGIQRKTARYQMEEHERKSKSSAAKIVAAPELDPSSKKDRSRAAQKDRGRYQCYSKKRCKSRQMRNSKPISNR